MELSWKNINIKFKDEDIKGLNSNNKYTNKIIDSHGSVKNGEVLAIIGSESSGKSILLNTLAGNVPSLAVARGEILLNKKPREMNDWHKNIGYINGIERELYDILTVDETLRYAAKFELYNNDNLTTKSSSSFAELVETRVNDAINLFDLKKYKKTYMKDLCIEDRIKTAFAIQMIKEPKILLIENINYDLDESKFSKLLKSFKELALKKGTAIIITIKNFSPHYLDSLDNIIFMNGGKTLFSGEKSLFDMNMRFSSSEILSEPIEKNLKDEKVTRKALKEEGCCFNPNLYHIYLLIHRMMTIMCRNNVFFIRIFILSLFYILPTIYAKIFTWYLNNNIERYILSLGLKDVFDGINLKEKIIAITPIINLNAFFIYWFSIIIYTINPILVTFLDFLIVAKVEISRRNYSISSLCLSYFLINSMGITLLSVAFIIIHRFILPNFITTTNMLLILVIPFITVPMGMFIDMLQISTLRKNLYLKAFILITMISIVMFPILEFYYQVSDKSLLSLISCLLLPIPTYHLSKILFYFSFKMGYNEIKGLKNLGKVANFYKEKFIFSMNYTFGSEYGIQITILFITFTVICLILRAIFYLSKIFKPKKRMPF